MKISKKSWHYRLAKWSMTEKGLVDGELEQTSLCEYVSWLAFLICLVTPTVSLFMICVSPFLLFGWIEEEYSSQKNAEPLPPREPRTLLGKWLKAKKEKVCPMLEWE
jgi:hypothetical protein